VMLEVVLVGILHVQPTSIVPPPHPPHSFAFFILFTNGTDAAQNNSDGSGDDDSSNALPPAEALHPDLLANLQPVDLLPLERTLTLFEAPNATVTFMDGSPQVAIDWLRKRVGEVVYRNPWLGGYLAKDRSRGGAVSLFYDPSSDEVSSDIFTAFEPGAIELARDTKYEDLGEAFAGYDVVVRCNADLVGSNQPIFRVCVIPDAKQPEDRFALVVSMSHVCGDGFTFHKIFKMLSTDCKVADIEEMNPARKHDFTDAVYELCGADEAFYVDKISRSPVWSAFNKKDDTVIVRAAFFIDEGWVEGQKEAWDKVSKMNDAEKMLLAESSRDLKSNLPAVGEDDVVEDGEDVPAASSSATESPVATSSGPQQPPPADFKVSFAAHQSATHITTNDIITSWFFRTCDATIGLMPFMLRNRLPQFNDKDAGNYAMTIPYPRKDYHTPMLIRDSRPTGRRVHTEDPLPRHAAEHRYGVSIDWRGVGFKKGGLILGPHGECKQVLHLPCYQARDLHFIPKSFSSIHLFNAGPDGEPACTVVCPEFVMERIMNSGIVKSIINESRVAAGEEDAFTDAVAGAKQGRRTSAYVDFVDTKAAKEVCRGLSTIEGDEED